MSFFKLLKKVADVAEALEDLAEEQAAKQPASQTKTETVQQTAAQQTVEQQTSQQAATAQEQVPASRTSWGYEFPAGYVYEPEKVRSREELLDDFRKLLKANFSNYDIYYQVPASELDGSAHPACAPVTFVFEKNGRYPLAVFVVRKNTYKSMNVVSTQKICEKIGMKCIRFYEEYANEDDYVVGRIRNALS